MTEKSVKCRKDYKCDQCGEIIKAGDFCVIIKERAPVYNNENVQVSVEYLTSRIHKDFNICNTHNGFLLFKY